MAESVQHLDEIVSIGSFMLVKNERPWIEEHLRNAAPYLDEMVFFDGNSTDGTLEIIHRAQKEYGNIRLFENEDPADLRGEYVRMFNKALCELKTDWAFFLHPDMWIENPERLKEIKDSPGIAMSTKMISYAGNMDELRRIETGRDNRWKNIYRRNNPDLGAHYFGWYGAHNEDVYFSSITGDKHEHFGNDFHLYPYEVADSGLIIHHFSDVRPYNRRLGRMKTCLMNQGWEISKICEMAENHPRVTLQDGNGFKFVKCEDPRRVHA